MKKLFSPSGKPCCPAAGMPAFTACSGSFILVAYSPGVEWAVWLAVMAGLVTLLQSQASLRTERTTPVTAGSPATPLGAPRPVAVTSFRNFKNPGATSADIPGRNASGAIVISLRGNDSGVCSSFLAPAGLAGGGTGSPDTCARTLGEKGKVGTVKDAVPTYTDFFYPVFKKDPSSRHEQFV